MNFMLLAAAAAQVFNLNCTGTYVGSDMTFSLVFRIDLSRKKWCLEECRRLEDFVEIAPTHLTFEKDVTLMLSTATSEIKSVDRVTGEYFGESIEESKLGPRNQSVQKGQCERLPFTGFPSFKTKF